MDKHEIHCTEEQTKKALNLGAPIELESEYYNPTENDFKLENPIACSSFTNGYHYAKCPTAEEMIGWLEEQDEIFEVQAYRASTESKTNNWSFAIFVKQDYDVIIAPQHYFGRKDATIAAIDAALNHLIQH